MKPKYKIRQEAAIMNLNRIWAQWAEFMATDPMFKKLRKEYKKKT